MRSALATIHVAKKQLGLDEDTYRALLQRVTGLASAKDMSETQRVAVVDELKRCGFEPASKASGKAFRKASDKAWVRLIFALWRSIGENGGIEDASTAALKVFVEKRTGVADPEWLTYAEADPLIRALKAMEKRAAAAGAGMVDYASTNQGAAGSASRRRPRGGRVS